MEIDPNAYESVHTVVMDQCGFDVDYLAVEEVARIVIQAERHIPDQEATKQAIVDAFWGEILNQSRVIKPEALEPSRN